MDVVGTGNEAKAREPSRRSIAVMRQTIIERLETVPASMRARHARTLQAVLDELDALAYDVGVAVERGQDPDMLLTLNRNEHEALMLALWSAYADMRTRRRAEPTNPWLHAQERAIKNAIADMR